ncbi:hypothetical protein ACF1BU_00810 [Streptomyces sp. NPDC014724]
MTAEHPDPAGAPLIRVTGTAGVGGVVVRHPSAWERWKLRRGAPR